MAKKYYRKYQTGTSTTTSGDELGNTAPQQSGGQSGFTTFNQMQQIGQVMGQMGESGTGSPDYQGKYFVEGTDPDGKAFVKGATNPTATSMRGWGKMIGGIREGDFKKTMRGLGQGFMPAFGQMAENVEERKKYEEAKNQGGIDYFAGQRELGMARYGGNMEKYEEGGDQDQYFDYEAEGAGAGKMGEVIRFKKGGSTGKGALPFVYAGKNNKNRVTGLASDIAGIFGNKHSKKGDSMSSGVKMKGGGKIYSNTAGLRAFFGKDYGLKRKGKMTPAEIAGELAREKGKIEKYQKGGDAIAKKSGDMEISKFDRKLDDLFAAQEDFKRNNEMMDQDVQMLQAKYGGDIAGLHKKLQSTPFKGNEKVEDVMQNQPVMQTFGMGANYGISRYGGERYAHGGMAGNTMGPSNGFTTEKENYYPAYPGLTDQNWLGHTGAFGPAQNERAGGKGTTPAYMQEFTPSYASGQFKRFIGGGMAGEYPKYQNAGTALGPNLDPSELHYEWGPNSGDPAIDSTNAAAFNNMMAEFELQKQRQRPGKNVRVYQHPYTKQKLKIKDIDNPYKTKRVERDISTPIADFPDPPIYKSKLSKFTTIPNDPNYLTPEFRKEKGFLPIPEQYRQGGEAYPKYQEGTPDSSKVASVKDYWRGADQDYLQSIRQPKINYFGDTIPGSEYSMPKGISGISARGLGAGLAKIVPFADDLFPWSGQQEGFTESTPAFRQGINELIQEGKKKEPESIEEEMTGQRSKPIFPNPFSFATELKNGGHAYPKYQAGDEIDYTIDPISGQPFSASTAQHGYLPQMRTEDTQMVYPDLPFDPNLRMSPRDRFMIPGPTQTGLTQDPGSVIDPLKEQKGDAVGSPQLITDPRLAQMEGVENPQMDPYASTYFNRIEGMPHLAKRQGFPETPDTLENPYTIQKNKFEERPIKKESQYERGLREAAILAPTAINLFRGLSPSEEIKAVENKYGKEFIKTLKSRKYPFAEELRNVDKDFKTAKKALKGSGASRQEYLTRVDSLNAQRHKAKAQIYDRANKFNIGVKGETARGLFQLGEQDRAAETLAQRYNMMSEANKQKILGAATTGVSDYTQMNKLMKNKELSDNQKMESLRRLYPDIYKHLTGENT